MSVVVVGSANVDLSIEIAEFPHPGETLVSLGGGRAFGGKGLNQAVAAALSGARTAFVGHVGDDDGGRQLRAYAESRGVDTAGMGTAGAASGTAYVMRTPDGQNAIIVSAGANALVSREVVARALASLAPGDVVVVQGEIPAASSQLAVDLAEAAGARPVVNLAPVLSFDPATLGRADPLVVNESEAARLLGVRREVVVDDAVTTALRLAAHARTVVLTLGPLPGVLVTDGRTVRLEPPAVDPVVDTTGAGDAFVGVLAAHLSAGVDLVTAAQAATAAASLTVTRPGASESFPDFAAVLPVRKEVRVDGG